MKYLTAVDPVWKWCGRINSCPAGRSARIRLSLKSPEEYANIRVELNFSNSDPQALLDELLLLLCSAAILSRFLNTLDLTLRLLMSYIYGAPSKARNANVVYIWTYVWQR